MRKQVFLAGFMFGSLFLGSALRADDWCHVKLQSTDNTKISIDYQVYSWPEYRGSGTFYGGQFVWINVSNPNFSSQEKVRALLIDNVYSGDNSYGERFQYTEQVQSDLSSVPNETRFTANLSNFYLGTTYPNGLWRENRMELAVVVDGNWLTADATTGEHNFKFVPFRSPLVGCPK